MATFSAVTRQHLLQSIAEYDSRGAANFLGVYGYLPSGDMFDHEGARYDAAAVLGVAHRYATGRAATTDELTSGKVDTMALLHKRGFDVPAPPPAPAPSAVPAKRRAPRTAAPRKPVVPEPEPAICPTCSMTLPATGICDDCG
ncbi:hypothetical protein GCM10009809_27970 [Isoptericola hypogeus]|uniref:ScoMcrA-like N-terminal head domain-containing protein n=1 Tax=Isoptericola hypogeus TaxID=300179 RepID=A0ABP4VLU6_9MICO